MAKVQKFPMKYSHLNLKEVIKLDNQMEFTIDAEGTKRWFNEDYRLHREDGPAIEWATGTKFWYIDGDFHRINGPAIEYSFGENEWWYENNRAPVNSQEEFEQWLKYKAFT